MRGPRSSSSGETRQADQESRRQITQTFSCVIPCYLVFLFCFLFFCMEIIFSWGQSQLVQGIRVKEQRREQDAFIGERRQGRRNLQAVWEVGLLPAHFLGR